MHNTGPELLTAEEVARILRLDEDRQTGIAGAVRAVHRLRRLHGIATIRLGGRIYFTPESLQLLVEACTLRGPNRSAVLP